MPGAMMLLRSWKSLNTDLNRTTALDLLPEDIEKLIKASKKALAFSSPLYSGFRVGAAVAAGDGRLFTGCNIENLSLTLNACAERVAVLKALSEGATDLRAIAVTSETGETCYPCGSCRQLLFEYAPGIKVVLPSRHSITVLDLKELLPMPFIKKIKK